VNPFILSKILELMVPVTFGCGRLKPPAGLGRYKSKEWEGLKKVPVRIENPTVVALYPLDSLEYYETTQLFDKYIENPLKLRTAEESLALQD
jgi:hypothetical protein